MLEIRFRAWYIPEKKMYFRAYQKLTYILLCLPNQGGGGNEDPGIPRLRAAFEDCLLMESTGILDKNEREIFEKDILRVYYQKKNFSAVAEDIPDMFKSRGLHPLHELLVKLGLPQEAGGVSFEIAGNILEQPELIPAD